MGVGLSILLLAAGAILAFAVSTAAIGGVDVHLVGWILMGAGALGLIWSLVLTYSRRENVVVDTRPTTPRVATTELPADEVVRRDTP